MSKGIVLFAYNSRQIDYAKLALLSGKLATTHLNVPASLITDKSTIAWSKKSGIYDQLIDVFENIIVDEVGHVENYRILHDGDVKDKVPFKNSSRYRVWELTPYNRTLLIDGDFLIFSNALAEYWDVDEEFLISKSIQDVCAEDRMKHYDRYISDVGIRLLWATTIMFTKNQNTKVLFDLIDHIRENYGKYSEIYRFDNRIYRNDIAFSLAHHILSGFIQDQKYFLPPVLSTIDKDILFDVSDKSILKFLIDKSGQYIATSINAADVHVMNKQSLIRNFDKLMELT